MILGKQGAGKGTQCARLARHYVVPHISTGDMLRAAARSQTEFGRKAKEYMDAGEYVPDEVTNLMVRNRIDEPDADGTRHRYNTQVLVERDGSIVARYRKVHIPGHEHHDRQQNHACRSPRRLTTGRGTGDRRGPRRRLRNHRYVERGRARTRVRLVDVQVGCTRGDDGVDRCRARRASHGAPP